MSRFEFGLSVGLSGTNEGGCMELCIADGCNRPADGNRMYCPGHRKREKKKQPISELRDWGQAPDKYLEAKAIELAEAKETDERAYRLALKRLKFAAKAWVLKTKRQKVPNSPDDTNQG